MHSAVVEADFAANARLETGDSQGREVPRDRSSATALSSVANMSGRRTRRNPAYRRLAPCRCDRPPASCPFRTIVTRAQR